VYESGGLSDQPRREDLLAHYSQRGLRLVGAPLLAEVVEGVTVILFDFMLVGESGSIEVREPYC
jgi:hypothetical protein